MTNLLFALLCIYKLCPVWDGIIQNDRCTPEQHGSILQVNQAILDFEDETARVVYWCEGRTTQSAPADRS